MLQWRPGPGQLALIEPLDGDIAREALTGYVLPAEDRVLIDLGASPKLTADRTEVIASFFTDEAMYRLASTAVAVEGRESLVELVIHATERVQRRSAQRLRVALPLSLAAFDGPGAFVSVAGTTVDLAPGGCRVVTDRAFPPGFDPTVSISFPDGPPLVALAHILEARSRPGHYEYRLAFAEIGDEDVARIRSFLPA